MQKTDRIISLVACALAALSLCVSIFWAVKSSNSPTLMALSNAQVAYKLYVVIPNDVTDTDDYIHRFERILKGRVTGFTIYPTRGGTWENDTFNYQTTLVCEIYDTNESTVMEISRDAMTEFNIPTVPVAASLAGWKIIQ